MTLNQKADELMKLLEQFSNFTFKGLSTFTLNGSPVSPDIRPSRVGLSDHIGLCDASYKHFYFIIDGWIIYFSIKTIMVRLEQESMDTDEIFYGTIDDFLSDYFQLSTQYDLFDKDIFVRIKNFMSTYNWVKQ